MIEGVATKELKPVVDERGMVMEILRCDDELFEKFGQAYITTCHPGIVKAWHCHENQTDHFCCVAGTAKVVLWDGRRASPTFREICEFFIGVRNPLLLKMTTCVIRPPATRTSTACVCRSTSRPALAIFPSK